MVWRCPALFALAVVPALACDELATTESAPAPLASITGLVNVPEGIEAPEGPMRAALVWYPSVLTAGIVAGDTTACEAGDGGVARFFVAQQVDLESAFPARFRFDVLEPPPAEALSPLPDSPGKKWTVGQLVIYRDRNGNDVLDTQRLDEAAADEIVGASGFFDSFGVLREDRFTIYYSEADMGPAREGFTLYRHSFYGRGGSATEEVPLDTTITVAIDLSPRTQTLACELICSQESEYTCPSSIDRLPDEGRLSCRGGDVVYWTRTTCDSCRCVSDVCNYELAADDALLDEICPAG